MLETLVSSKIRRAVLGYLLTHAEGHFYLRGLAKELGLAVSPLRRELKRMEQQGLLKAYQEGNMLFYMVDRTSARFAELCSLGAALGLTVSFETPQPESATAPEPVPVPVPAQPSAPPVPVVPVPVIAAVEPSLSPIAPPAWGMWRSVGWGVLGAAVAGMAGYLVVSQQQLMQLAHRTAEAPAAQVKVITNVAPSANGELRGHRWRLMPGSVGGFAPGRTAIEGSY